MIAGFRVHTRRHLPGWLVVIALFAASVGAFEAVRVAIPFQSSNPLWQQVTIGQSVINGWMYGGEDEEGYLRFYSQAQSIVLPPSAHLFTADGTFVVIEHYTPSTLTFAQPWNAIPTGWLFAGAGVLVVGGYVLLRRSRRRARRLRGAFRTRGGASSGGITRYRWRARDAHKDARRTDPPTAPQGWPSFQGSRAHRRGFRPTRRSRWFR